MAPAADRRRQGRTWPECCVLLAGTAAAAVLAGPAGPAAAGLPRGPGRAAPRAAPRGPPAAPRGPPRRPGDGPVAARGGAGVARAPPGRGRGLPRAPLPSDAGPNQRVPLSSNAGPNQRVQVLALPRAFLAKDMRRAILKDQHPWLFDRSLKGGVRAGPGDLVGVAWKKDTLAVGFYDPESPLRVRLLTWDTTVVPDEAWARRAGESAAARRRDDRTLEGCTGVRLLHGEGDWTPGLVLDAYDGVGVVAFDGSASEAFWRPRLDAVLAGLAAGGFALHTVVKKKGGMEQLAGVPFSDGPLAQGPIVFEENGVRFEVDVLRGHKTGFFLDQRDNRRRLRELSEGKEVLDLFTYTGGFAVSAALGGAKRTVAVDQAEPAIRACGRNYELNGLSAEIVVASAGTVEVSGAAHALHVADCFDYLNEAKEQGELFDIVVNDPPSMAPSARTRAKAITAYVRLNQMAFDVLRPGGLILACSCSSHITSRDLHRAVEEAAQRVGRRFKVEAETRAGTDHPVRRGFPEGDYLQVVYVRALD